MNVRGELRGVHEHGASHVGTDAAEKSGRALFPNDTEDAVEAESIER